MVAVGNLQARARALGRDLVGVARAMLPHLWLLSLAGLVGLVFYFAPVRWMLNAWETNPYYGHGVIVALASLFFVWRARKAVASEPEDAHKPQNLVGVAAAVLVYVYGYQRHDPFWMAVSFVIAIWAIALVALGWKRARHLAMPVGLLFLGIPVPYFMDHIPDLQVWTTSMTIGVTSTFGLPYTQDGSLIYAGAATFDVGPLCSGLSSLLSIVTLTTLLALVSPMRTLGRFGLVAVALPLALAANVARIVLTVWLGSEWDPRVAQGFFHGTSDILLFGVALGGVFLTRQAFLKIERRKRDE